MMTLKKPLLLLSSTFVLSGCFAGAQKFPSLAFPQIWGSGNTVQDIEYIETAALEKWWQTFEDPVLNTLVELAMNDSPDRLIAEARILEARGLRRTALSALFPQIEASATGGRQDNALQAVDNFYDAGFDASFELDVFGKNRKALDAADADLIALQAEYQDVTLTLIAEVSRSYINYRAFQKQTAIAQKNLELQKQTLGLIRDQQKFGEATQLDVERAENLVNTTKASIPEFRRLDDNARLQLSVLTGYLPEDILPILKDEADIPGSKVEPVLMSPADVLTVRPDIRAATANLASRTALAESATAEIFPSLTLSGFFGVTDNALVSSATVWNTAVGAAVALLDFGRIEGAIDAARAREAQAYQAYRRTVLAAVTDVETALVDTAHINERRLSLQKAYNNADRAFNLSQTLYKEGEISFLDLLDSQRTVNEADSALIEAEAAQAESLIRLYKSLGVY